MALDGEQTALEQAREVCARGGGATSAAVARRRMAAPSAEQRVDHRRTGRLADQRGDGGEGVGAGHAEQYAGTLRPRPKDRRREERLSRRRRRRLRTARPTITPQAPQFSTSTRTSVQPPSQHCCCTPPSAGQHVRLAGGRPGLRDGAAVDARADDEAPPTRDRARPGRTPRAARCRDDARRRAATLLGAGATPPAHRGRHVSVARGTADGPRRRGAPGRPRRGSRCAGGSAAARRVPQRSPRLQQRSP